jgi:hypothetical protein
VRWEEKLFNALMPDTAEKVCRETIIEREMNYYYQHMDTEDLVTAGNISDIGNGYGLLADMTLKGVLTVYCAFGHNFNQFMFKNEMEAFGFNKFFAHRVFCQLETWRKALPKDITEEEMNAGWSANRKLPDSVVYLEQQ